MSVGDDIHRDRGVPEACKIVVRPDHFLVLIHFNAEGIPWAGMAVSEAGVAVWKAFDAGEPGESDAGQIFLGKLPDDAAFLVHFEHAVAVACREEGITVLEASRTEGLISERLGTVSTFGSPLEEGHCVLPNDFPIARVFPDLSIAFMRNEVGALGGASYKARVAMFARFVELEFDLQYELAVGRDLNDAADPGFRDHRIAVWEAFERMDFQWFSGIAVRRCAVVFPHGFPGGISLNDTRPTALEEDVPIRQKRDVV